MDLLQMAEAGGKKRISKWTKPVTSLLQYQLLIIHKIKGVLSYMYSSSHSGVQNLQQDLTRSCHRGKGRQHPHSR